MQRRYIFLKRALLGFWALWLTVVVTTNVLDGAKAMALLPKSWAFASGNYAFLIKTTARYEPPDWVNVLLFVGVVCWEAVAALLFWLACWSFSGRRHGSSVWMRAAFTVGLGLWAAFMIADEIVIGYPVEATHVRLFIAQLATLLAVELLPEDEPPGSGMSHGTF